MKTSKRIRPVAVAEMLLMFLALPTVAAANTEVWDKVRTSLFGEMPVTEDQQGRIITLETPKRAMDAAIVPVAIRSQIEQTPDRYIEKIWLVVDNNPSPVGAEFTMTPKTGRASIETRIRIEEYTNVRAIARLNDGSVYMATKFVKASGGCSAPAGKDLAAAKKNMGRMRLRVSEPPTTGEPTLAQLMISHPNVSGLAMDQLTRNYAPPHFVRHVEVRYRDELILEAEVDFTISENPNFRFWFVPEKDGELVARVIDSEDLAFNESLRIKTR